MMHRRRLLGALVLLPAFAFGLSLATPDTAAARDGTRFTQAAFDAAKASGKPILVDVTAPWCPTCRAQKPILSELTALPKFKDMVVFEVDFDSQKDVLRALKAQSQSTLIVFRGAQEKARSVGDTKKASIEALLDKAI